MDAPTSTQFYDETCFVIKNKNNGDVLFASNKGQQTELLRRRERQVLGGGGRGGGKSYVGRGWLLMGNLDLDPRDPWYGSYLHDPEYSALVLRRHSTDLQEWVREAYSLFEPLGARIVDDPPIIKWPGPSGSYDNGPKFYTNHLKSDDAFNKYKGWNLTKILIEEMTEIPKLGNYLNVFASCRNLSANKKRRPQNLNTTNPDGIGSGWVYNYFVDIKRPDGSSLPWGSPYKDPITGIDRVFVQMLAKDNPYAMSDAEYMGVLMAQEPKIRDAWLYGIWNTLTGQFFSDFRDNFPHMKPRDGESAEANHVVHPVPLQPWWMRWAGGDWGYHHKAAFYKMCLNQDDRRIHVYDELIRQRVGSFELGQHVADWLSRDLAEMHEPHFNFYLSPDAFAKRDDPHTIAEQFRLGIDSVLGHGRCFLAEPNQDEKDLMLRDPLAGEQMYQSRVREWGDRAYVTVQKANHNRPMGASYCRDLLNWRKGYERSATPDMDYAMKLFNTQGQVAYETYIARFRDPLVTKPFPPMVIWGPACPALVKAIPQMNHDPDNPEDVLKVDWDPADPSGLSDDEYDGWRYTSMGFKDITKTQPLRYYMAEQMEKIRKHSDDPNIQYQMMLTARAKFEQQNSAPSGFSFPRAGASLHRRPN